MDIVIPSWLFDFVRESNKIEGIVRPLTDDEMLATAGFIALPKLTVANVANLVAVYQPDAVLRDKAGLNVCVGNHVAPRGGENVRWALVDFLAEIGRYTPHQAHIVYETMHPFTDGNGRSGRAIWLWQMKEAPLGFLHHFYYQTLQATNK